MKTLTQVVLPIAVIIGLVFGVTFMSNYIPPTKLSNSSEGNQANLDNVLPLQFEITTAARDVDSPHLKEFQVDYEYGAPGRHGFWFRNPHELAAKLTLIDTSCTCSSVQVGLIKPDAWSHFIQCEIITGLFPGLPDLLGPTTLARMLTRPETIRWQPLIPVAGIERGGIPRPGDTTNVEVPAAPSEQQPQLGVCLLGWNETKSVGPMRLYASLAMSFPGKSQHDFRVEANIRGIPLVNVFPERVDLGTLTANGRRQSEFFVYSTTRDPENFVVDLEQLDPNPFMTVGQLEPLNQAQQAALEQRIFRERKTPLDIRAAQRVQVEVQERVGMQRIDLGPIRNRIKLVLDKDPADLDKRTAQVAIEGVARGVIRVLDSGRAQNVIDLGQPYASSRERIKEVTLASDDPKVKLALLPERITPKYVLAELSSPRVQDGIKQWTLKVTIPANRLFGKMPLGSGIRLQISGPEERMITIPIQGTTASAF